MDDTWSNRRLIRRRCDHAGQSPSDQVEGAPPHLELAVLTGAKG